MQRNERGRIIMSDGYGRTVEVTQRELIRAVMMKVERQFPHFTDPGGSGAGYSRLLYNIVRTASMDLTDKKHRAAAIRYFRYDCHHAEICGLSVDWIYDQLEEVDAFEDFEPTRVVARHWKTEPEAVAA